jgi:hypothetical protein
MPDGNILGTLAWRRSARSRAHYSPEQADAAVAAYRKGMAVRAITATYGLSNQALYVVLARAGEQTRRSKAASKDTKFCLLCGDPFIAWPNSRGLFCCEQCRREKERDDLRKAGEIPICLNCEYELPPGTPASRLYCSPRCREEAKCKIDKNNAATLRRKLSAGLSLSAVAIDMKHSTYYLRRLIRDYCPKCGERLRKEDGRRYCLNCGWTNAH